MVSEIHPVDELKARADEFARARGRARIAAAGIMHTVRSALDHDLETALDTEREAVRACQGAPDQAEGRFAFLEKRDPVFE